MMLPSFLTRLHINKFNKNILLVIVGLLIIIGTSLMAYSQRVSPPPISTFPETNFQASSSASIPLKVTNYSPRDRNPPIAESRTAIYFEFNRPLTDQDLAGLQLTSKPAVIFKKIAQINRQIVYFTPMAPWTDNVVYTVTLSLPQTSDLSTFYLTPTSQIDQGNVLRFEENIPKP